jgi:replicative DNA helicase
MGSSLNVRTWLERYLIVKGKAPSRGILTGYPFLDNTLGGFQRGQLVVLMGVPGIGKTALCLEFGMEASRHVAVLHVSRKDAPGDLCERLLLQANDLHSLPQTGQGRFSASAHLWQELRYAYVFEDGRGQSLAELLEGIRHKAKELLEVSEPLGLVVVDGTEEVDQDPEAVGDASVQLARELDVCLILTVPSGIEPKRFGASGSDDSYEMFWQKFPGTVALDCVPSVVEGGPLRWTVSRRTG